MKKFSLVMLAVCSLSSFVIEGRRQQKVARNSNPRAISAKARELTDKLVVEQEKEERLAQDPKATKEQKEKQQEKVKSLREQAIDFVNNTKKKFDALSPSMKVLVTTVGITGTAIVADYAFTGGKNVRSAARNIEEGVNKVKQFVLTGSWPEQVFVSSNKQWRGPKDFVDQMQDVDDQIKKLMENYSGLPIPPSSFLSDVNWNNLPLALEWYVEKYPDLVEIK